MDRPSQILPIIVFSQFAGTSLWFAGNAILADVQVSWGLGGASLGWMTSSVQLGFIAGTFLFSILSIVDRYSPPLIFLICSLAGALSNYLILVVDGNLQNLVILRFCTGFFLAGIYPVGMKIAAGWYQKGLGRALGYLVGALVAGTAFPHLVKGFGKGLPWETVIVSVSVLAATGGIAMFMFVKNGPYHSSSSKFEWSAIRQVFKVKEFRSAAFGYFGHMWELYALWTFVPFILIIYSQTNEFEFNIPLISFLIIGSGALGCVIGGLFSNKTGSAKVAYIFLLISGICCLLSIFLMDLPFLLFISILLIWGFTVVADSPQFSTLNALTAPKQLVGTGLTIVTSIGFAISILSIELLNILKEFMDSRWLFLALIPGPVFGLRALRYILNK
jgi:predicted MFS family arabinose efflux permease